MVYSGVNQPFQFQEEKPVHRVVQKRETPMKRVILRILFSHSDHIYDIALSEDEARSKMELWRSEGKAGSQTFIHGYDSEQDRYYTIRTAEISSMFTLNIEKLKQQQEEAQKKAQAGTPSVPPRF